MFQSSLSSTGSTPPDTRSKRRGSHSAWVRRLTLGRPVVLGTDDFFLSWATTSCTSRGSFGDVGRYLHGSVGASRGHVSSRLSSRLPAHGTRSVPPRLRVSRAPVFDQGHSTLAGPCPALACLPSPVLSLRLSLSLRGCRGSPSVCAVRVSALPFRTYFSVKPYSLRRLDPLPVTPDLLPKLLAGFLSPSSPSRP